MTSTRARFGHFARSTISATRTSGVLGVIVTTLVCCACTSSSGSGGEATPPSDGGVGGTSGAGGYFAGCSESFAPCPLGNGPYHYTCQESIDYQLGPDCAASGLNGTPGIAHWCCPTDYGLRDGG